MRKDRLYVDFHILQTLPPSCVNRDDTGSPKTAYYGGSKRARVSSQAWKRAMRTYFTEVFAGENIGKRTRKVSDMLSSAIRELKPEADAEKMVQAVFKNADLKYDEKKGQNAALFFISEAQIKALASLAVEGCQDKKLLKAALKEAPAYDMVLFGRMVADDPSLNYDATAQVAHSISTHAIQDEFDYFTAVDDCAPEDNAGAGHIGTVEYNSSLIYRYATVNVAELAKHLGQDTADVVQGFAEAFILSMPTGKQNSFANRTCPDMVYVTVRQDQPVNLCGAFEKAVSGREGGYLTESIQRLQQQAEQTYRYFFGAPLRELVIGHDFSDKVVAKPMQEALTELGELIREQLAVTAEVK